MTTDNRQAPHAPEGQSPDQASAKPHLDDNADLVVPAHCDSKYRWWTKEGMNLVEILVELRVSRTVWEHYTPEPYPEELRRENYPLL